MTKIILYIIIIIIIYNSQLLGNIVNVCRFNNNYIFRVSSQYIIII